jgi:rubrerythrin
MSLLSADKLLEIAIMLEDNGEKFYRRWAEKMEAEDRKKFFLLLADEEIEHKKLFEEMREKIENGGPDAAAEMDVSKEYDDYIKTFSEEVLFNEEELEDAMAETTGLRIAIEYAIKQELDSLLFYTELMVFVAKEHIPLVRRIREEEQQHFVKLTQLRKKLSIS